MTPRAVQPRAKLPDLGVLILAAGKSSRIASVTGGRPKPLLEIGGKTLIRRHLEWVRAYGVDAVWVNLHHRSEEIRSALGAGTDSGLRIMFSLEETILGTAGGWKRVAEHEHASWLVIYGDNLMRFDLADFHAFHTSSGAAATIAVFDPDVNANTKIAGGRVRLGPDGIVTGFQEGAGSDPLAVGYVNAGAYFLESEVLRYVGAGLQDFGRDVFPALAAAGRIAGHVIEPSGYCLGVDTPETLATATDLIARGEVILQ